MAIYRNVYTKFWTDPKITDEFTPEDKYFYLYLFTNPHTNLCGCYELSKKAASWETGYSKDTIDRLIERFQRIHKVISYNPETREVLLLKWFRYNWTTSKDFRKALEKQINEVKTDIYREYLISLFNDNETVPRPSLDGLPTVSTPSIDGGGTTVTVTDTVTDADSVTDADTEKKKKPFFEDEELNEAFKDFIEMRKKIKKPMTEKAITLSISKLDKLSGGSKAKAIAILNQSIEGSWTGLYPLKEPKQNQTAQELDDFYNMAADWAESEG